MKIDLELLKKAIELAEKDGPLQSHDKLWSKVADIYNLGGASETKKQIVNKGTVYYNVRLHGLPFLTKRKKIGRPIKQSMNEAG